MAETQQTKDVVSQAGSKGVQHNGLDESLEQAMTNLTTWVHELERRIHEIDLLSDMDDQLQTCYTIEEMCAVVATFMQCLFTTESGVLYLFDHETNLVNRVTSWGDTPWVDWTNPPRKCWALQMRTRSQALDPPRAESCYSIAAPQPTNYLCVPIVVQDQAVGLLQIWLNGTHGADRAVQSPESGYLAESKQRLAVAAAELIALTLEKMLIATPSYVSQ